LITVIVILLINMDRFLFVREGRYTTCSWNRGYDQPTDWLTILPSILLSKYNASLTGPPATLFTRCHVSQTWLLSTASLAGTHSRNELFHPSRRVDEREREKGRKRERTREGGREPGEKVSVYDVYPRVEGKYCRWHRETTSASVTLATPL